MGGSGRVTEDPVVGVDGGGGRGARDGRVRSCVLRTRSWGQGRP